VELRFSVDCADRAPRLFACDRQGRLQLGVEHGTGDIAISLHNFPAGCVRIFVARRQFGWRVGDPIEATTVQTFDHDGADRTVALAHARDLPPGSYQFIARAYPPGWHASDEPVLLAGDVISDRTFASCRLRVSSPAIRCVTQACAAGHGHRLRATPPRSAFP
jgi:hypothetical protein